jgi:hypothetical protein
LSGVDSAYDKGVTAALLERISVGAERDAERVGVASCDLGGELAEIASSPRLVSTTALRLANRLRQLDCAAYSNLPINKKLYADIRAEAEDELRRLAAAVTELPTVPAAWVPQKVRILQPLPQLHPLTPDQHRERAQHQRIGAGVLFLVAAGALAGTVVMAKTAADIAAQPPCAPNAFFCFDDLTSFTVGMYALGAALLGAATVAGVAGGGALIYSARRHDDAARLPTPSLAVSPTGASGSLTWRF